MKKGLLIALSIVAFVIIVILSVVGWGVKKYNAFVGLNEGVNQSWSQVENVYQRRSDLIPNLVATVKGVANFEKETYTAVTEARAKVGQVKLSSEQLSDPEAFQRFQRAQDGLSGALSRLMVVSENYPQLKADANFRQLQSDLSDIENKIAAARRYFNNATNEYNTSIQQFPAVLLARPLGFKEESFFEVDASEQQAVKTAPKVGFGG